MGESQDNNNNQGIEVTGGPVPFKLRGRQAFLWLLITVLLAAIAYLTMFSLGQWGTPIDMGKTLTLHSETDTSEHRGLAEAQDESTYVLSVCLNPHRKKECEELNLRMPSSLQKKQRQQQ